MRLRTIAEDTPRLRRGDAIAWTRPPYRDYKYRGKVVGMQPDGSYMVDNGKSSTWVTVSPEDIDTGEKPAASTTPAPAAVTTPVAPAQTPAMSNYNRKDSGEINGTPFNRSYINPDILARSKAVPFYFGDGQVFYGQPGEVHGNVLPRLGQIYGAGAYQGSYEGIGSTDGSGKIVVPMLVGRVGLYQGNFLMYVSFWNQRQDTYSQLLSSCIQRLRADGLIDDNALISTPLHGTVTQVELAGNTQQAKQMSPEEQEMHDLAHQMHTMTGAQKQAAMKKLGVGGQKPHPIQTAMDNAGLRVPGQKWWAMNSESRVK